MTNEEIKTLSTSIQWSKLGGLIPAITQDYFSGEVLMQAYMNEDALSLTLQTKIAHYFSRSKNRIWKKGEESGNIQEVYTLALDCDKDSVLLGVKQHGVACHTGKRSCFFNIILENNKDLSFKDNTILELYQTLLERKQTANTDKSYTAQLLNKGETTIAKKIVEEAAELGFAIKDKDTKEIVYEAADLLYHALVGLVASNVEPTLVCKEIKRRFNKSGIEEKLSRNTNSQ